MKRASGPRTQVRGRGARPAVVRLRPHHEPLCSHSSPNTNLHQGDRLSSLRFEDAGGGGGGGGRGWHSRFAGTSNLLKVSEEQEAEGFKPRYCLCLEKSVGWVTFCHSPSPRCSTKQWGSFMLPHPLPNVDQCLSSELQLSICKAVIRCKP